jgi:phage-related protein
MSFDLSTAETLLEIGSFGLTEEIEFRVLEFQYGDGYEDSVLIGSTEGTLAWKLTFNTLPGFIGQAQGGVFSAQSKADYIWDFYCRHMAAGNKSFKIVSPRSGNMYLAAFAETKLSFQLMLTKLYTTGITLKQRREAGVVLG